LQDYFAIHPSRTQLVLLLVGHGLLALAVAAYVEPATISLPAGALILLLGVHESRRESRHGSVVLHCDLQSGRIALQCGEQPYFYRKYKVYATRWFAILKLIDNDKCRTLILNSDRFDSASSYHRLRYLLRRLERSRAA
jgi:hypothetical protein